MAKKKKKSQNEPNINLSLGFVPSKLVCIRHHFNKRVSYGKRNAFNVSATYHHRDWTNKVVQKCV